MTEADRNQPAQDQQDAPTLEEFTESLRSLEAMASRLGIKAISTGHGYWPGTEAARDRVRDLPVGPYQGDTRVQHRRRAHPRLDLILRKENRLTLRQSPQNTAAIPQDAARGTPPRRPKPRRRHSWAKCEHVQRPPRPPHRGLKIPPGKEMP